MFHVSASTVYKNLLFDVLIDNNGPSSNKKKLIQGSIKATECCPCKFTGYENCDIANTMYYYSILGPDKPKFLKYVVTAPLPTARQQL